MNNEISKLTEIIDKIIEREKNISMTSANYRLLKSTSKNRDKATHKVEEGIRSYNNDDLNSAYQLFSEAINIEADADAYFNRGVVCMDYRQLFNAITDFTAAILLFPIYANAYHNRALSILQILSENSALDNYKLVSFAKKDLTKSLELGNTESLQYLQGLEG